MPTENIWINGQSPPRDRLVIKNRLEEGRLEKESAEHPNRSHTFVYSDDQSAVQTQMEDVEAITKDAVFKVRL